MKIKVRPDMHHAPLSDGVYISAGSREVALTGWAGFAGVMERCLPLLHRGADEDTLVEALGTERARPAVQSLLRQMDQHDMLIRLDGQGLPEPGVEARAQHAELLAYLESRSADPYAAFARIRSATVLVAGPEEVTDVVRRTLGQVGLQEAAPTAEHEQPGATIVVMGRDEVGPLPTRHPRMLPVVVAGARIVVGPLVDDNVDEARWRALVERATRETGQDALGAPGTSVAASLAAHLLLQELAQVAGPTAYVVDRETGDVRPVDLPPAGSVTSGELCLPAVDTGSVEDAAAWLTRVCDPWVGAAVPAEEDDLPQMPVALRRLRTRDQESVVFAPGATQEDASAAAVLDLARLRTPGGSAGVSAQRWLLDGGLLALEAEAGKACATSDLDPEAARLAEAVQRRTGEPASCSFWTVPGLSWVVGRCILSDGRATTAWGPDPQQAVRHALARAVAVLTDEVHGVELLGSTGRHALIVAAEHEISSLADELRAWGADRGLVLTGVPAPVDPVLGPGPVHSGRVTWRAVAEVASPASVDSLREAVLAAQCDGGTDVEPDEDVVLVHGWDHEALSAAVDDALRTGRTLVTVRTSADAIVIGPRFDPSSRTGCVGCAEVRRRAVLDHVLSGDLTTSTTGAGSPPPTLIDLAAGALAMPGARLDPGELVRVSADGVSRHRIARHPACPWCAGEVEDTPPEALGLVDAPVDEEDPTRLAEGTPLLRDDQLEARVVDETYGPVRGILREANMPFAMSMAVLTGAPAMGHGRAVTFGQTRSVAVLEAYERLAGFPHEAALVTDRSYRQVQSEAVDPATLGRYTAEQLAHESSRVTAYHPDLPMDWAWGFDLATGERRLVPAEVAFFHYEYAFKRDMRAAQAARPEERRRVFLESSSGCALGSSVAEAAIHALVEVGERDAFQLAWHRATPLPQIPAQELADPVVDELVALVRSRGFDVHFLVADSDIGIPVIWVLAVSSSGGFPASFSSAGSGALPVDAARSGLREVAQLVTMPLDWSREDLDPMLADPWLVRELEDHVKYSSSPEMLPRVRSVLGGPQVGLAEAYPDWPDAVRPASGGILGTLELVRQRFAQAGLTEIVLVDQSTREHRDQGVAVVKAVVPGTVPMVFGTAHQRVMGLPRLDAALAQRPGGPGRAPYDPHPFP